MLDPAYAYEESRKGQDEHNSTKKWKKRYVTWTAKCVDVGGEQNGIEGNAQEGGYGY